MTEMYIDNDEWDIILSALNHYKTLFYDDKTDYFKNILNLIKRIKKAKTKNENERN